jgi:hypothetical protein
MPRRSVAAVSLEVIGPGGVETIRRPAPPDALSDEEAEEWRAVVNRLPATWFPRETHSMLTQYCRQVVRSNRIAEMIQHCEQIEPFDEAKYLVLIEAEEKISRSISSLATRMRLTQLATVRHELARKPPAAKAPWSRNEDADE